MTKSHEEYHREGICFSEVAKDRIEVQKIDFPEEWEKDYEYDFKIPELKDDHEAKKVAEKMGIKFLEGIFVALNIH